MINYIYFIRAYRRDDTFFDFQIDYDGTIGQQRERADAKARWAVTEKAVEFERAHIFRRQGRTNNFYEVEMVDPEEILESAVRLIKRKIRDHGFKMGLVAARTVLGKAAFHVALEDLLEEETPTGEFPS